MQRAKASERADHEHAVTGEKLALMAVFARPENESFGPAGTLARYAGEGIRVATVTISRVEASGMSHAHVSPAARDQSCSCLTSGNRRICLLNYPGGQIDLADEATMEERLVRLIRELRPQVIVTYGATGMGDPEHALISRVTVSAFDSAGDPTCYPEQMVDGLAPFSPLKLYYSVLPQSAIESSAFPTLATIPDDEVTAVLDVSDFGEAKNRTLYCQRDHRPDYVGAHEPGGSSGREYFVLAATHLRRRTRKEKDLFAGLR